MAMRAFSIQVAKLAKIGVKSDFYVNDDECQSSI